MKDIITLLDEVFNNLENIQANHAFANFNTSSDKSLGWVISIMRYNEEDEDDTDQESFHGTQHSVQLEANMETIAEHLLTNYPLDNIKWGHFKFNYYNRSITSSVEFKQTKVTKAAKPKKIRKNK
jgi:hypothetical protein